MGSRLIATYLSALSTLFIAILAIWGDWFRAKLAPPKLKIDAQSLVGQLTLLENGKRAIFYHLKVVNYRRWISIRNCRVQLVDIFRRNFDGQWLKVPLPYPIQLTWVPAEFSPLFETITHERMFDIGFLLEADPTGFQPRIIFTPYKFNAYVGKGEAYRYSLQIVADNYVSPIQVFEVSWDGTWTDNVNDMKNRLVIKEIPLSEQA